MILPPGAVHERLICDEETALAVSPVGGFGVGVGVTDVETAFNTVSRLVNEQ